jgi:hypothetical protein
MGFFGLWERIAGFNSPKRESGSRWASLPSDSAAPPRQEELLEKNGGWIFFTIFSAPGAVARYFKALIRFRL